MIVRTTAPEGQYIRATPGLAASDVPLGIAYPGEIIEVLPDVLADVSSGALPEAPPPDPAWLTVRLRRVEGYMLRALLEEVVEVVAPMGLALVGIDAPAPQWAYLDGVNYELIKQARVEAVKVYCAEDIGGAVVERLRSDGVGFVMARIYAPLTSRQSGTKVMRELAEAVSRLYAADVRYFEVTNETNLWDGAMGSREGLGICWGITEGVPPGEEFAAWWLDAAAYLRARFPDILLGFPAMSPGPPIPGFRYDPAQFMREADEAIQASDWIAQHVYWEADHVGAALAEVESFARQHPDRIVIVTEFGNPSPWISNEWRAAQYVEFYERAKLLPRNVGALICFTLSNPGFPVEQWRGNGIAEAVGGRK